MYSETSLMNSETSLMNSETSLMHSETTLMHSETSPNRNLANVSQSSLMYSKNSSNAAGTA